jgi:hypothetical protein
MHGGTVRKGIASPHWKHGRYSTALPEKMAALYYRSMNDPHLMNMRSEIALLDARLYELAEKFQAVEGPLSEGEIRDAWAEITMTIEARRRVTDTANRIDSENHLTAEQALALIGGVATAVRNVITRRLEKSEADAVLAAVSKAIHETVGEPYSEPILVNGQLPQQIESDI